MKNDLEFARQLERENNELLATLQDLVERGAIWTKDELIARAAIAKARK